MALLRPQRVPQIFESQKSCCVLREIVLFLRAAACAAALQAAITGSVPHHQHAAELTRGRISQSDDLAESVRWTPDFGPLLFPVRQFEKDSLLTLKESEFEPAK